MAFNKNQPRAANGRWVSLGGLAEAAGNIASVVAKGVWAAVPSLSMRMPLPDSTYPIPSLVMHKPPKRNTPQAKRNRKILRTMALASVIR